MTEQKRVPLRLIGATECPAFYANVTTVLTTQFDFQIVLAEVVQASDNQTTARAVGRVILSPEVAQILIKTLQFAIAEFEINTGSLRAKAVDSVQLQGGRIGGVADVASLPEPPTGA